eukprot:619440-Amphidinium_carterae.1
MVRWQKCHACGWQNSARSSFCPSCGVAAKGGGPPSRSQPPAQKGQGKGPRPQAKNNQERLAHVVHTWGPQAVKIPTRSEWICSSCFLGNFHTHVSCRNCHHTEGWPAYYHMPATPTQWGSPMATNVIIATFPAKPNGTTRAQSLPPGGPLRGQTTAPSAPAAPAPQPAPAPSAPIVATTDVDVDMMWM